MQYLYIDSVSEKLVLRICLKFNRLFLSAKWAFVKYASIIGAGAYYASIMG